MKLIRNLNYIFCIISRPLLIIWKWLKYPSINVIKYIKYFILAIQRSQISRKYLERNGTVIMFLVSNTENLNQCNLNKKKILLSLMT